MRTNGQQHANQQRRPVNQGAQREEARSQQAPSDEGALAKLVGTYTDGSKLREALDGLAERAHLVTPLTGIGQIPRGYGIALSAVMVDIDRETYVPNGNNDDDEQAEKKRDGKQRDGRDLLALKRPALLRIAAAAGVTFVKEASGRLDDGSDPAFCHYRSVARVRDPDGSYREEPGERTIDLRPGSAQARIMWGQYEAACRRKNRQTSDLEFQKRIDGVLVNLPALTETKSRLRAVRNLLGLTTYTEGDLEKPFVALKLVFTGDFGNAHLNEVAAKMITADALGWGANGAAAMLYGPGGAPGGALPAPGGLLTAPPIDLRGPPQHPPGPPSDLSDASVDEMGDAIDAGELFEDEETTPARPAAAPSSSRPAAASPEQERADTLAMFEAADDETQANALVRLAFAKGKLGNAAGQAPEEVLRRKTRRARLETYANLLALPDAPPDDDDVPAFSRGVGRR